MSEVIRISEPTYKRLESLARGFDTPGNVIDRLLDFYERHGKKAPLLPITPVEPATKGARLPRGVKTTDKAYYRPILREEKVDRGLSLAKKEDFSMGISDEVINIIALQKGIQMILCKTHEKANRHIFLIPKTSFKSDFEPSKRGRELMGDPIDKDTTRYVAKIENLSIPGKNKKFWQELYNEREFDIWNPDQPYEYFHRSKKSKMLLWILRVYKMPFEIKIGKDFSREPRGNAKISNPETLKRIQSGFDNGEFRPVLEDNEFERRKKKIIEIAEKYG